MLGMISIVTDYEDDDGEYACGGSTMPELREWNSDNPEIIICKKAGFGHGGIAKSYAGVPEVVYTWFAVEVLWSVICSEEYEDPIDADDDDPNSE
ncbi:uncharacterized protein PGRI_070100 [Penicillium griseofulvum]|uniref:Uncharacterized protein n=1 Tax=Penicillium patulum TaxID=5078 RepID=A0A135LNL0_PENPA|nr:uncharacterized protein PGRI_070100 [Penicillium griseofulvum]KXG50519.1 hypothetical protein PGRI_070100 [Penicillium griseofulvum]